jgi:hypothetical protein
VSCQEPRDTWAGWGSGWRWLTPAASFTEGYMTSRTVREASGLLSLTSTLYLRLNKTDRDASFHCAANYSLPSGHHGRLDSPVFHLTLHCESIWFPGALASGQYCTEACTPTPTPKPTHGLTISFC